MSETLLSVFKWFLENLSTADHSVMLAKVEEAQKILDRLQWCVSCQDFYIANSHEYPCPRCQLAAVTAERDALNKALAHRIRLATQLKADAEKYRKALDGVLIHDGCEQSPADCLKQIIFDVKQAIAPAEPVKTCGECQWFDQECSETCTEPEHVACHEFEPNVDAEEQERLRTGHA